MLSRTSESKKLQKAGTVFKILKNGKNNYAVQQKRACPPKHIISERLLTLYTNAYYLHTLELRSGKSSKSSREVLKVTLRQKKERLKIDES